MEEKSIRRWQLHTTSHVTRHTSHVLQVTAVKDVLMKHFSGQKEGLGGSRAMVFVETRACVQVHVLPAAVMTCDV